MTNTPAPHGWVADIGAETIGKYFRFSSGLCGWVMLS
jgi:hypothetical protein